MAFPKGMRYIPNTVFLCVREIPATFCVSAEYCTSVCVLMYSMCLRCSCPKKEAHFRRKQPCLKGSTFCRFPITGARAPGWAQPISMTSARLDDARCMCVCVCMHLCFRGLGKKAHRSLHLRCPRGSRDRMWFPWR